MSKVNPYKHVGIPLLCIASWMVGTMQAETSSPVMVIGSQKQLFVDDALIESRPGVELRMNAPYQSSQPVLTADAPWEKATKGLVWGYGSIFEDEGKIRLWYGVLGLQPKPQPVGFEVLDSWLAYAESTDGIHFKKPSLGIHKLGRYAKNNIVFRETKDDMGWIVWKDDHAPASQRYRVHKTTEPYGTMIFYTSPDGLHWTKTHESQVGQNDTQNTLFWDTLVKRYVFYTRLWIPNEKDEKEPYRIHRRIESDDLKTWNNEVFVLQADEKDLAKFPAVGALHAVDYYGACVFRYPDENGVYIMLAQPYWHWQKRDNKARPGPNAFDVRMLVSRDGKNFQWVGNRAPFLRPGPMGTYSSRSIWVLPEPIRRDDELWIYYEGQNFDHDGVLDPAAKGVMKSGIGRAILRLDGFVSADAGYEGGEIVTKPMQFEGNRLQLNVDTSTGGAVWVELLDEQGKPIAGYTQADATPIIGNSVTMPVSWGKKTDVSALAGKPIRLRFILKDVKLYAFQFVTETK